MTMHVHDKFARMKLRSYRNAMGSNFLFHVKFLMREVLSNCDQSNLFIENLLLIR